MDLRQLASWAPSLPPVRWPAAPFKATRSLTCLTLPCEPPSRQLRIVTRTPWILFFETNSRRSSVPWPPRIGARKSCRWCSWNREQVWRKEFSVLLGGVRERHWEQWIVLGRHFWAEKVVKECFFTTFIFSFTHQWIKYLSKPWVGCWS